jgi:hypothetical protein
MTMAWPWTLATPLRQRSGEAGYKPNGKANTRFKHAKAVGGFGLYSTDPPYNYSATNLDLIRTI